MNVTQLPSQLIPESQKGLEWMKENGQAIYRMAINDSKEKKRDVECWNMYHNIYNEKEFEYLTKIKNGTKGKNDYYLPAKVRHIPIQRSKLNVLISQQKHRPYQFSCTVANSEARTMKFERMVHAYIGGITQEIEKRVSEYNMKLIEMEQQQQQLQAMLQQEPQTPEQAQQQQEIKVQLPMIEQQITTVKNSIIKERIMSEKDHRKMSNFYQYERGDIVEDLTKKLALKLKQDLHIQDKSLKNFVSQVVTGKQYYLTDYNLETFELEYENLNELDVYFPAAQDVEWVQDGSWAMVKKRMTLNQAKDKFNLTKAEMESINNSREDTYTTSESNNSSYTDSLTGGGIYSGTGQIRDGIDVYQVYWRSIKKIQVKKSPNPHAKDKYFLHFLDDEPKVMHEGQLYWDKKIKKYVDTKSGNEYEKKDVILGSKGEKLETRYIDEIYEGVIVGGVYKNFRKKPVRNYSNENYSKTILPIIGKTFNSITDRPYSLVWDTKDIQKLYNLLNWHRELLLATSGVKGTVMDMSQKPESMSKEEWMYYKKLGVQWIETMKKHGRPMAFNQFGNYDDTLSASIQYIDNMLHSLNETMGNIIGVGSQRQGQVVNSDQVGTYQMAIQQNSLITEVIYAQHDEIQRRALESILNLAIKYKYKDGGDFDYITDNLSTETFRIPAALIKELDIQINVANNTLDEQRLKELKQFAIKEYDKGLLPFKDMMGLYTTDTLIDMEKKFHQYTADAYEIAQANAQNAANMEVEKEKQLMEIQGQIDGQLEQMNAQLKQMDLQLQGQIAQMTNQTNQDKLAADIDMHRQDNEIKIMELSNENIIEQQIVSENSRSNKVGERLQLLETQMAAIRGDKEIKVKEKQASKQSAQHASDR